MGIRGSTFLIHDFVCFHLQLTLILKGGGGGGGGGGAGGILPGFYYFVIKIIDCIKISKIPL